MKTKSKATAKTVAKSAVVIDTTPTEKQVKFLSTYFPLDLIKTKTRAECSAKVKQIIDQQRASRAEPATQAQINFLADHGYARSLMALRTKGFCSKLIYQLKAGKAA